jgi:hypothetical protein
LIELIGPLVLLFNPQVRSGFELRAVEGPLFEADALIISIIGGVWGITRFVAGWGIWSTKKWAIALGIVMSTITMMAAIDIIPAGVLDTILSAPVLVFLLHAWFGQDTPSGKMTKEE